MRSSAHINLFLLLVAVALTCACRQASRPALAERRQPPPVHETRWSDSDNDGIPEGAEVRAFTDRPAIISETGASGPHKVAWIASFADFLTTHRDIAGFVWFDTAPHTTGATGDYRISDTGRHLAVFSVMLRAADVACTPATTPNSSSSEGQFDRNASDTSGGTP